MSCPHKAEAFADFFDDKVNKIRATTHSGPPVITTRLVHPFASFASCSAEEVIGFIKRAPNKHCELDPAPTWIVKECGDLLAPVLSTMINGTFESGIFPDEMKHAMVKPILKKAGLDAMDLKSWRPISNLSFTSKLAERIATSRLRNHLSEQQLLPETQSAYRQFHSTETALTAVVDKIVKAVDCWPSMCVGPVRPQRSI